MTSRERYYGESIDAMPFGLMVNAIGQVVPRPIAFAVTFWFRLRRWLGIRILPSHGIGGIGSETVLDRDSMPPRAMSRWADWLEQLADRGFTPLRYSVENNIGAKESASIVLISSDSTIFAYLDWFQIPGAGGVEERRVAEFNSLLESKRYPTDSTVAVTEVMTAMAHKNDLALQDAFKCDHIDTVFLDEKQGLPKALRAHEERIQQNHYAPRSLGVDDALQAYDEMNQRRFDLMLERGYLRELTLREIDRISRKKLQ